MDEPDARLRHLADLAGIEPFHWDLQGNRHETSPETARQLLWALGIPADDPVTVAATIREFEESSWRSPLDPVAVVRSGGDGAVFASLPAEVPAKSVRWRIIEEDGNCRLDPSCLDDAPIAARREIASHTVLKRRIQLPVNLPEGYHRLHLDGAVEAAMPLIVAPARCYLSPAVADDRRVWGIAAQLYALRSEANWGVGDFGDLARLCEIASALGAATVGVNPLHALFQSDPEWASPYSPNSRLFLNPWYLDVTAVSDLADCEDARDVIASSSMVRALGAVKAADTVAYGAVARLKRNVLERLYESFRHAHLARAGDARAAEFRRFLEEGGERLRRFALFEALSEHLGTNAWGTWPASYRHPGSGEVSAFARDHSNRVEFFQYLQWQAELQLAEATRRAGRGGLTLGIYRDLALSSNPDGADVWSEQDAFALGARIGAPPDPFNALGQDWGLPPFHPARLRVKGYAPFIALLRANMRHAGVLRLDHVMGLMRLFWVPRGGTPAAGAYVRYPFEDLLGILALESRRGRCVVIGEDLGTVPEGFRPRMAEAGVLSYRVLYFERDGERFKKPGTYPRLAAACVSTHDLPTLKGFWTGASLEERERLGLFPSEEERRSHRAARLRDRRLLLDAVAEEGLLPAGVDPNHSDSVAMTPELMQAIHLYLARTPCCLLMVQIDDLAGEEDQVNLPGTTTERPNWRRKLSKTLQEIAADPVVRGLAAALLREDRDVHSL
jgi:4-alpha-glucanotransferase